MRRVAGELMVMERLNPYAGYFYTVRKVLYRGKTRYQKIELLDTQEFGHTLLLDGITQVVEKNDYQYHEPMVHPGLCSHPNPRRVLVVGAGDGGILREVLKYPTVERAELAELDEEVVKLSRKYLPKVHGGAFDDPRVSVNIVDGRKYVEANPGTFDVVVMDMTDPFGPSKMLYTREFFKAVKRSLRGPEGVFVMHTESPVVGCRTMACIYKTLRSVFEYVRPVFLFVEMYATYWSIGVCSDRTDIGRQRPSTIDRRLAKYRIHDLKVYTGATHQSMQVAFPYVKDVLAHKDARIITDARPDFPDRFEADD